MKEIRSESHLIRFLTPFSNKKGHFRLVFQNQNHVKEIRILDGEVTCAHSNLLRDKLSEILFKAGRLSRDQYMLVTELSIVTGKRVGEILVRERFLPRPDVVRGLRYQARKIVCDLFGYPEWKVKTEVDSRKPSGILPDLPVIRALMAGVRSVDNLSVLCSILPREDAILECREDRRAFLESVRPTPEETLLLGLVDGKRSLARIREEAHMLEYRFSKTLYPLLALRFVRVRKRPVRVRVPAATPAVPAGRAETGPPEGAGPRGPDLAALFEEAKLLLSTEQYGAAANRLKRLIRLEGRKSAYYYYLGLALDHIPGQNKEAEKVFKIAIRLENYNPRYYLALGYLYLNRNMERQAREQFLKAQKWDPDDPYVREALEHLDQGKAKGIASLTSRLFC